MRSLIIGSILAITFSCSAQVSARTQPTDSANRTSARAAREAMGLTWCNAEASPCAGKRKYRDTSAVTDLNALLADRGSKSTFAPVPEDVYAIFATKTNLPKGTKSMVADVTPSGMIVAPLDAKGCVLGTAALTMEDLNKLGGKDTPPAAEKPAPDSGVDPVPPTPKDELKL